MPKTSGPDCIPVVSLKNCEFELFKILNLLTKTTTLLDVLLWIVIWIIELLNTTRNVTSFLISIMVSDLLDQLYIFWQLYLIELLELLIGLWLDIYITVALYISNDFYRIWHTGLYQKLISYGILGWLFVYFVFPP